MFDLNFDGDDVTCPHCNRKMGVKWRTEYGDPLVGEHQAKCANYKCEKEFNFSVYHQYNSWK